MGRGLGCADLTFSWLDTVISLFGRCWHHRSFTPTLNSTHALRIPLGHQTLTLTQQGVSTAPISFGPAIDLTPIKWLSSSYEPYPYFPSLFLLYCWPDCHAHCHSTSSLPPLAWLSSSPIFLLTRLFETFSYISTGDRVSSLLTRLPFSHFTLQVHIPRTWFSSDLLRPSKFTLSRPMPHSGNTTADGSDGKMDLRVGGKYRIGKKIGSGSFGTFCVSESIVLLDDFVHNNHFHRRHLSRREHHFRWRGCYQVGKC